jgi:hypothetical protein
VVWQFTESSPDNAGGAGKILRGKLCEFLCLFPLSSDILEDGKFSEAGSNSIAGVGSFSFPLFSWVLLLEFLSPLPTTTAILLGAPKQAEKIINKPTQFLTAEAASVFLFCFVLLVNTCVCVVFILRFTLLTHSLTLLQKKKNEVGGSSSSSNNKLKSIRCHKRQRWYCIYVCMYVSFIPSP